MAQKQNANRRTTPARPNAGKPGMFYPGGSADFDETTGTYRSGYVPPKRGETNYTQPGFPSDQRPNYPNAGKPGMFYPGGSADFDETTGTYRSGYVPPKRGETNYTQPGFPSDQRPNYPNGRGAATPGGFNQFQKAEAMANQNPGRVYLGGGPDFDFGSGRRRQEELNRIRARRQAMLRRLS